MSSLINNAMSGLNAAQAALNTASNNISSYNVAGYTRQTTIMEQANSTLGAGGWVGNGVFLVCSVSMMRLLPTSYVRRRRKVAV
ncbi:hypothetical protein NMG51_03991 [Escherichia coli]|nr:hypothetical protein [Escherichia coli]